MRMQILRLHRRYQPEILAHETSFHDTKSNIQIPLQIVMFQVTIEDQLSAGLPRDEGEGGVEKVVKRQVGFETGTFGPPTVIISCTRQGQRNQVRVGRIRMMADNSMYNECYISLGPSLVARPCLRCLVARPCCQATLERPCCQAMLERPCCQDTLERPCCKDTLERKHFLSSQKEAMQQCT